MIVFAMKTSNNTPKKGELEMQSTLGIKEYFSKCSFHCFITNSNKAGFIEEENDSLFDKFLSIFSKKTNLEKNQCAFQRPEICQLCYFDCEGKINSSCIREYLKNLQKTNEEQVKQFVKNSIIKQIFLRILEGINEKKVIENDNKINEEKRQLNDRQIVKIFQQKEFEQLSEEIKNKIVIIYEKKDFKFISHYIWRILKGSFDIITRTNEIWKKIKEKEAQKGEKKESISKEDFYKVKYDDNNGVFFASESFYCSLYFRSENNLPENNLPENNLKLKLYIAYRFMVDYKVALEEMNEIFNEYIAMSSSFPGFNIPTDEDYEKEIQKEEEKAKEKEILKASKLKLAEINQNIEKNEVKS